MSASSVAVGAIAAVAGTGTAGYNGDGGPAAGAKLNSPSGVAVDGAGNLYIADTANQRVRMVSTAGLVTTVAGSGTAGLNGDGGPAPAGSVDLYFPSGVAADSAGHLYIADTANQRVRMVDLTATPPVITTVAGSGIAGYNGDGGPAAGAHLYNPSGVAVDGAGNLYIADTANQRVRMVSTAGLITTVAGSGTAGLNDDRGPAPAGSVDLHYPSGVAADSAGHLYIADTANQRVRMVDLTATPPVITTVAGTGTAGYNGDGGPAAGAQLNVPSAVAVDDAGHLYIADTANQRVRMVDLTATPPVITTVAGSGAAGYNGDGGAARDAQLNAPSGVAVDREGNLHIADRGNHRVRQVELPPHVSS